MIMKQISYCGFKWGKSYENTSTCDRRLINISVIDSWIVFEVVYYLL